MRYWVRKTKILSTSTAPRIQILKSSVWPVTLNVVQQNNIFRLKIKIMKRADLNTSERKRNSLRVGQYGQTFDLHWDDAFWSPRSPDIRSQQHCSRCLNALDTLYVHIFTPNSGRPLGPRIWTLACQHLTLFSSFCRAAGWCRYTSCPRSWYPWGSANAHHHRWTWLRGGYRINKINCHLRVSRLGPCVLDLPREAGGRELEGKRAGNTQEKERQEQHPGTIETSLSGQRTGLTWHHSYEFERICYWNM